MAITGGRRESSPSVLWLNAVLISDDSLQRTDSQIVYSRIKFDPAVIPFGRADL